MDEIRILHNEEIDKNRWDNLLLSDPLAHPYSLSWYLDIVSPNWKALIVGDYHFALALPFRKKWGFSYVFPPEFTQQMGIFGKKEADDELVSNILEEAAKHFSYLEINLSEKNELKRSFQGLKKKRRKNFELDLSVSYDELFDHFHKNTQRNIKKAKNEHLVLSTISNPDKMIKTFKDFKGKELKAANISYDLLRSIIKEGVKRKAIELYDINSDEDYLGSALFLTIAQRKVFLFSAINDIGRKKRAMFFLIDSIISANATQNILLDFEGSDNTKLASFYERFGAKEKLYLHIKVNRLPFLIKWLKD